MNHRSMTSPLGPLTLFEEDGRLTALEWGQAPDHGAASDLLVEAERQLQAYFDGPPHTFHLPLAPLGTPFQRAVWSLMEAIPPGRTRTYGDLAHDLASSARAVGGACGRNPIPIVIPCHRVVAAGGRLGGFSGGAGLADKKTLLRLEGALPI